MDVTIEVKTVDGNVFNVDRKVIEMSSTLKNLLEDMGEEARSISLPNTISGQTFRKVLEYCQYYMSNPKARSLDFSEEIKISPWDEQFCKVDNGTIFNLFMSANYLDIRSLLELMAKKVAYMVKEKSFEELKDLFGITGDITPEDEEQTLKENPWLIKP